MLGNLRVRVIVASIVLGFGILFALPSFVSKDSTLAKFLPKNRVKLGLDLQGGINLVLGIDMDKAISNALEQIGEDIRAEARKKGAIIIRPRVIGKDRLSFYLVDSSKSQIVDDIIKRYFNSQITVLKIDEIKGRKKYLFALKEEYKKKLKDLTLDQVLKVIRNRIDQFGVVEPDIRKLENYRIQVQLPGIEDANRAIDIIKKTAHLEFKLVDDDVSKEQIEKGDIPVDDEVLYLYRRRVDGSYAKEPIVVKKQAVLTGDYITDASVAFDQFNQPYVTLSFNRQGARIFERVTGENVNKRLAIILDNKVYSAPVIREKISGGRASITGRFTLDEAHDLAIVLRAGSLPAPVSVLHESSVGPSLGEQSIRQGLTSILTGGGLVFIFTIIYYGVGGLIVDILLVLNLILVIAVLAGFGATLTMPGIAGLILLIGTAVDASVLIFERIREELRKGLSAQKAVEIGFSRSTLTIVDANLTTILAAIILYQFGSGPVRGFAVTLSVGTFASMFTAIYVSKIFFALWLKRVKQGAKFKL
ncbi:protein translocase subunit SecD [Desulfothermus okinawensis JCM 13304]